MKEILKKKQIACLQPSRTEFGYHYQRLNQLLTLVVPLDNGFNIL